MNTKCPNLKPASLTAHASAAFTMIEIALSLAVIGFALVAIIGVLPMGMNVQKDNREETIINQDANLFLDGIRNGAQGLDYLTNYVVAITNSMAVYQDVNGIWQLLPGSENTYGYSYDRSWINGAQASPSFPITNGFRIIGLLSTPKYFPFNTPTGLRMFSNHVVAYVRSLSGNASEKAPQDNLSVRELAYSYRMICDVVTNAVPPWLGGSSTNEAAARTLYANYQNNTLASLHDVRLTFRWPLLPTGDAGPGRQVFRALTGGLLLRTNQPGYPEPFNSLYFFQPRTYVNANLP